LRDDGYLEASFAGDMTIVNLKLTQKKRKVLEDLDNLWESTVDLIERQEHSAQKEGEPVTFEDGSAATLDGIQAAGFTIADVAHDEAEEGSPVRAPAHRRHGSGKLRQTPTIACRPALGALVRGARPSWAGGVGFLLRVLHGGVHGAVGGVVHHRLAVGAWLHVMHGRTRRREGACRYSRERDEGPGRGE
jgi:hypothetical protein